MLMFPPAACAGAVEAKKTRLAAVCDPAQPKRRNPFMPEGFTQFVCHCGASRANYGWAWLMYRAGTHAL